MILTISQSLVTILTILITTAYLTLIERNILASAQIRNGPNLTGTYGILQPIADALNLILNETINAQNINNTLFTLSPILAISVAFTIWTILPLNNSPQSNLQIGVLVVFAFSSLGAYTVLLSGWASNSNYALLGSIRATAQMISYEICIGIILLATVYLSSSLDLTNITHMQQITWYLIPLFPAFVMFLISSIAETNRTPFDLTESESELVSGFNVEYSAILFTLLFLAEYLNIILMAGILSIIFLGGSTLFFSQSTTIISINIIVLLYFFVWTRATYPRMRYDQLMDLLWNSYLPLSLALTIITPSILIFLNTTT